MDLSSLALLKSHLRESSFLRNLTFSRKVSVFLAKASFLFSLLLQAPFALANVSFSESELEEIRADIQFIQSRPKMELFEHNQRQNPSYSMHCAFGCVANIGVCSQISSNEKDFKECLEKQDRDRFCSWDKIKDQYLSEEGMNAYQINSHLEYDLYHRNNLDCAFCDDNDRLGVQSSVDDYFSRLRGCSLELINSKNKNLVRLSIYFSIFLKDYNQSSLILDEYIEKYI